jgi:hypothetical protein
MEIASQHILFVIAISLVQHSFLLSLFHSMILPDHSFDLSLHHSLSSFLMRRGEEFDRTTHHLLPSPTGYRSTPEILLPGLARARYVE